MAKKAKSRIVLAKLYSHAGTGYIYYFRRPRTASKMALRKYDPVGKNFPALKSFICLPVKSFMHQYFIFA
jgi:ribosomal protein L33